MPSRLEITQQVLAQLGDKSEWNLTQAMRSWWRAGEGWGLQLSTTGYGVFRLIEHPRWKFELADPVTGAAVSRGVEDGQKATICPKMSSPTTVRSSRCEEGRTICPEYA